VGLAEMNPSSGRGHGSDVLAALGIPLPRIAGGESGKCRIFPFLSPNAFSRIGDKGRYSKGAKPGLV